MNLPWFHTYIGHKRRRLSSSNFPKPSKYCVQITLKYQNTNHKYTYIYTKEKGEVIPCDALNVTPSFFSSWTARECMSFTVPSSSATSVPSFAPATTKESRRSQHQSSPSPRRKIVHFLSLLVEQSTYTFRMDRFKCYSQSYSALIVRLYFILFVTNFISVLKIYYLWQLW